jgi:hypothetical protein
LTGLFKNFPNGISMLKCACGGKPQDDDFWVKGKNINMVFLHTPFQTAIVKTLKQN